MSSILTTSKPNATLIYRFKSIKKENDLPECKERAKCAISLNHGRTEHFERVYMELNAKEGMSTLNKNRKLSSLRYTAHKYHKQRPIDQIGEEVYLLKVRLHIEQHKRCRDRILQP